MKKSIVIILLILILSNCTRSIPEYRKISAEEAHEMMSTLKDFILLDVRTESEYSQKHISGAKPIPYDEINERAQAELPDKKAVILVYCASGGRSGIAAKELAAMGYVNVYDFGGIGGWPYETVGD